MSSFVWETCCKTRTAPDCPTMGEPSVDVAPTSNEDEDETSDKAIVRRQLLSNKACSKDSFYLLKDLSPKAVCIPGSTLPEIEATVAVATASRDNGLAIADLQTGWGYYESEETQAAIQDQQKATSANLVINKTCCQGRYYVKEDIRNRHHQVHLLRGREYNRQATRRRMGASQAELNPYDINFSSTDVKQKFLHVCGLPAKTEWTGIQPKPDDEEVLRRELPSSNSEKIQKNKMSTLPVEILGMFIDQLDFWSLSAFRQTARFAYNSVHGSGSFAMLTTFAPHILRYASKDALESEIFGFLTISQVAEKLWSPWCELCNDVGEYWYPFLNARLCSICIASRTRTYLIPEQDLAKTESLMGVNAMMPYLRAPEESKLHGGPPAGSKVYCSGWINESVMGSFAARTHNLVLPPFPSQGIRSRSRMLFAAKMEAFRRDNHLPEGAVNCAGCDIKFNKICQRHTVSLATWKEMSKVYTYEEFLEHIKVCLNAQKFFVGREIDMENTV